MSGKSCQTGALIVGISKSQDANGMGKKCCAGLSSHEAIHLYKAVGPFSGPGRAIFTQAASLSAAELLASALNFV